MKKNIFILFLTIFSFGKSADVKIPALPKLNQVGQVLADGLPTFSYDLAKIVGDYLGYVQVAEFHPDFGEQVIAMAQLQNGNFVYATKNQIIICNQENQEISRINDQEIQNLNSLVCHKEFIITGQRNGIIKCLTESGNVYLRKDTVYLLNSMNKFNNEGDLFTVEIQDQGRGFAMYQKIVRFDEQIKSQTSIINWKYVNHAIQLSDGNFVFSGAGNIYIKKSDGCEKLIYSGDVVCNLIELENGNFVSGHLRNLPQSKGLIIIWTKDGDQVEQIEIDHPIAWLTALQNNGFAAVDDQGVVRFWKIPMIRH